MARLIWRLFTRNRKHSYTAIGAKLRRYIRAAAYIFNVHTLTVLFVALLSVFICLTLDIRWNMDFSLVATGTVFPLTYTISQAYARRERATVLVANLKASVVALYFMHRDWDQAENYPASLGNDQSAWALKCKVLLVELLVSIKKFLTIRSDVYESTAEQRLTAVKHDLLGLFEHEVSMSEKDHLFAKSLHRLQRHDPGRAHLSDCYRALSILSVMNEQLTMRSGYTRGGEGGLSRTNQYLRYIISNIEELRMIKEYRTPAMMRHACSLLFHIFAVILAPYFSHFCDTWLSQGHKEEQCPAAYMGAAFYVLIVMLLLHCEQDLEDCFDETSLDDVFFTLHEEVDDMAPHNKVLLNDYSSRASLNGQSPPGSTTAGRGSSGEFQRTPPHPPWHNGFAKPGAGPHGGGIGITTDDLYPHLARARSSAAAMHTIPSETQLKMDERDVPACRSPGTVEGERRGLGPRLGMSVEVGARSTGGRSARESPLHEVPVPAHGT